MFTKVASLLILGAKIIYIYSIYAKKLLKLLFLIYS